MKTYITVVGFLTFLGLVFLWTGISIFKDRRSMKERCKVHIHARVVNIRRLSVHRSEGSGYSTRYYPVYEYEANGEVFTKDNFYCFTKSRYHVGQELDLYYNPADPADSYTPVALDLNIELLIGITTLVAAVGVLVVALVKFIPQL